MRKYVLPIAIVVLLLVGVAIWTVVLLTNDNEFVKDITLKENSVTWQSLEFSANGLKPGDVKEYTINIKGKSIGNYTLNFDFVEVNDGALKNYVDVALQYGGKSYTYKLSELLDGRAVSFSCRVDVDGATAIKVIYSMPTDTGNEAQKATCDFRVNLTAEKLDTRSY